jgi:hypothetical protein
MAGALRRLLRRFEFLTRVSAYTRILNRPDWEAGKATVVKAGPIGILALNDLEEHSTVSPYRES